MSFICMKMNGHEILDPKKFSGNWKSYTAQYHHIAGQYYVALGGGNHQKGKIIFNT